MVTDKTIYSNGVDALTGDFLVPPLSPAEVVALARGVSTEAGVARWLRRAQEVSKRLFLGLPYDVNPKKVSQAGWAIVFSTRDSGKLRDALAPLIALRRKEVPPDRLKFLQYHPDETMTSWQKRHGVAPGNVDPRKIPYYVLLAGDPTEIPFEFQCLLDVEYAVGRLAFDHVDQYRQYADSIVAYEESQRLATSEELIIWGTRHEDDPFTQLSSQYLTDPLCQAYQGGHSVDGRHFAVSCLRELGATKANLLDLLHRPADKLPPSILLTASHGMGWPKGHPQQRRNQGSLLCQEWTGLGSVNSNHYLTGAEVTDSARIHGLVLFMVACHGAGVPAFDSFLADRRQLPLPIANQPFVSALPQRLLSHPQGGALAVIGHVERLWSYSFAPPGLTSQLIPFRNFLGRALSGEPVGHAMKDFNMRYAALAAELLRDLDDTQPGPKPSVEEIARKWIERTDAQNYVVLGDPAVRLHSM